MSFYLGPYAIVNPFEEISGSLKKTCPQGHSHVVNHNLNFNQINIDIFNEITTEYIYLLDLIDENIQVYSKNNDFSAIKFIKNYKPTFQTDTFYIKEFEREKLLVLAIDSSTFLSFSPQE